MQGSIAARTCPFWRALGQLHLAWCTRYFAGMLRTTAACGGGSGRWDCVLGCRVL